MRGTCTLLMIVALLPSAFSGKSARSEIQAGIALISPRGREITHAGAPAPAVSCHRFLKHPLGKYIAGLCAVPPTLLLRRGKTGQLKPLTYIPEGRISADILRGEMAAFPLNFYKWLILAGLLVFLVQAGMFVRWRNEARRRRAADRSARRSGEFEQLLSETASRLAGSGPESTAAEIKRGLSQIRSHFAVD